MNLLSPNEQRNSNSTSGQSGVFNYKYPSVNSNGIRAFMGRIDSPGSITSYYLKDKENENVNGKATGTLYKVN